MEYEPLEVVGSGSFGLIRKVRRARDGMVLARKEIDYRKMSEREKKQLVSEVNILRELKHPHIVRYLERVVDRANGLIYIYMEFCEGGDLASAIKKCKKEGKIVPEETVWNLMSQLVSALCECHHGSKNSRHPAILHRDIKPENVFLDGNYNVKLGDFGLSRVVGDAHSDFARTYVGTPFYMSPELVNETSYNAKSDIWALGCLIYELCTHEPPFQAKTQSGLHAKIRQGKFADLPQFYSRDLNRVVKAMLHVDQEKRPGTLDIMKLDRIRFILRDREIQRVQNELKRRDEELLKRAASLEQREAMVIKREQELLQRESSLQQGTSAPAKPATACATTQTDAGSSTSTFSPPLSANLTTSTLVAEKDIDAAPAGYMPKILNPFQKTTLVASDSYSTFPDAKYRNSAPKSHLELLNEKRQSGDKAAEPASPNRPAATTKTVRPMLIHSAKSSTTALPSAASGISSSLLRSRAPFNERPVNAPSPKKQSEHIIPSLFSKISLSDKKESPTRDAIRGRPTTLLHHYSSSPCSKPAKDRDVPASPLAPRRRVSMAAAIDSPKHKPLGGLALSQATATAARTPQQTSKLARRTTFTPGLSPMHISP